MGRSGASQGARAFIAESDQRALEPNRSLRGSVISYVALAFVTGLFAIPSVVARTHTPAVEVALLAGAIVLSTMVSSVVFWRVGAGGRAFQIAAYGDAVAFMFGGLTLVYRSGSVASAHWVWFVGMLLINTGLGWFRMHGVVGALATIGLALAFLVLRDDAASAAEALIIGASSLAVYVILCRANDRVKVADWERTCLERELAAARATEARRQVARDLHDGLGAELTALLWKARELATTATDPAMRAELAEIVEVAGDGIDELRDVVVGLRGPTMAWNDFVALMRTRLGRLCGARVTLEIIDTVPNHPMLADDTRQHLARIMLEGVRNALRHSGATRIRLYFEANDGLRVIIEDDGRGLDPRALASSDGGLRNLRDHAAALGGTIAFSLPASGTRIELNVPLLAVATATAA